MNFSTEESRLKSAFATFYSAIRRPMHEFVLNNLSDKLCRGLWLQMSRWPLVNNFVRTCVQSAYRSATVMASCVYVPPFVIWMHKYSKKIHCPCTTAVARWTMSHTIGLRAHVRLLAVVCSYHYQAIGKATVRVYCGKTKSNLTTDSTVRSTAWSYECWSSILVHDWSPLHVILVTTTHVTSSTWLARVLDFKNVQ